MNSDNTQLLYFAYGSNMAPQRLQARVPSAQPLQRAMLPGHALRFHKHSRVDGSAKCDACHTGEVADAVHGLLYRMPAAGRASLDRAEGLGQGYNIKTVELVVAAGEVVNAFTYYATDINNDLRPYGWYLEHVLRGARYAGLPEYYIAAIEAIVAAPDPDAERHLRELAIYTAPAASNNKP